MFLARLWCMVAGRPALDRSHSVGPGALVQAVRTCGQPRGAGPGRGARFLLCASVLLVLGWSWALPVPAQSESEPALQFTSPAEFQVHPNSRLLPRDLEPSQHLEWRGHEGVKWLIFDSLSGHQADDTSLTFAVEGQAGENYVYCLESAENCGQVQVRVNEDTGWLLLGADVDAPRNADNGVHTPPAASDAEQV